MKTEYHKWWSPSLERDMELKVYGHYGFPLLVFPSQGGTFHEYENFGMIDAIHPHIESGKVKVFTIGSVDNESWLNLNIHPHDRKNRHDAYRRYVLEEVRPFIHRHNQNDDRILTHGCSMGAFHAVDFFLRNPDVFGGVIGLSGLYGPHFVLGDYMDDHLYFNFPLLYMENMNDGWTLDRIREGKIILCVGRGPWERCDQYDCISETEKMQQIFASKNIDAWVDFWGHDSGHGWDWWQKQMPYFLDHL